MPNKFSDFLNSNVINDNAKKQFDDIDTSKVDTSNFDTKNMQDLVDKYSTYTNAELMNEFMKLTKEKKENGTLNDDLERMSSTLSPYLTEEQRQRMNDLFNKVK